MELQYWKQAYKLAEEKDKRAVMRANLLETMLVKDCAMIKGITIPEAEKQMREQNKIFCKPYLDSHGNKFFAILPGQEGLTLLSSLANEAAVANLAEGAFRVIIPNLTGMDALVWQTWKNNYFTTLQKEFAPLHEYFALERATYREDPFKRITLHFGYKPRGTRARKIAEEFKPGFDTDRFAKQS